ncbi:MAG: DUF4055 domain-containing protein [Bacteroidota bacterium]
MSLPPVLPPPQRPSVPTPDLPSAAWLEMCQDWDVVRDVYQGTRRMREKGEVYLPKHPRESKAEYQVRLQRTTLTNILRDAVMNTAARPFSRRVTLTETSPDIAKDWCDDIDLMGRSLHMFAVRAFREALLDGMCHVLIDMAVMPQGATRGDEMAIGARPFLTFVPARDLLAAYMTYNEAGEKICCHARIRETAMQLVGFQEELIERVRVYYVAGPDDTPDPVTGETFPGGAIWELWERGPAIGWHLKESGPMVKSGGELWDRVPLETFYAGTPVADFICPPPFLDLAWKNVEHWQSSSDQRNILTKGRFPMLAVSGVEDISKLVNSEGELEVGPHTLLVTPSHQAQWYYVEPKGAAIKAGEEDLKRLTEEARIMGLDPLLPQNTGQQTATERAIDESKARAPLEQWAWEFADFMRRCFDSMFLWVGLKQYLHTAEILLDTDMGLSDKDKNSDLPTLIQLRQVGDISRHTLFEELKRRGLLGPYFDAGAEEMRLEEERLISLSNAIDAADAQGASDFGAPPQDERVVN